METQRWYARIGMMGKAPNFYASSRVSVQVVPGLENHLQQWSLIIPEFTRDIIPSESSNLSYELMRFTSIFDLDCDLVSVEKGKQSLYEGGPIRNFEGKKGELKTAMANLIRAKKTLGNLIEVCRPFRETFEATRTMCLKLHEHKIRYMCFFSGCKGFRIAIFPRDNTQWVHVKSTDKYADFIAKQLLPKFLNSIGVPSSVFESFLDKSIYDRNKGVKPDILAHFDTQLFPVDFGDMAENDVLSRELVRTTADPNLVKLIREFWRCVFQQVPNDLQLLTIDPPLTFTPPPQPKKRTHVAVVKEDEEVQFVCNKKRLTNRSWVPFDIYYSQPPSWFFQQSITVEQFETLVQKRFTFLNRVEELNVVSDFVKNMEDEWQRVFSNDTLEQARIEDTSSFWFTLLFVTAVELIDPNIAGEIKQEFCTRERRLFISRVHHYCNQNQKVDFGQWKLERVPFDEEIRTFYEKAKPTENWYSIPFEEALQLVSKRKCLLRLGKAIISQSQVCLPLSRRFVQILQSHLSKMTKELVQDLFNRQFDQGFEIERNLIKQFQRIFSKSNWNIAVKSKNFDGILDIEDAYKRNLYPLCVMEQFYTMMKPPIYHLHHSPRWDFGCFLRTAGWSPDNIIAMAKKTVHLGREQRYSTESYFNNKYATDFRPTKEKKSFCKNCSYKTSEKLESVDLVGCPFSRKSSPQQLDALLQRHGIVCPQERVNIVRLAKKERNYVGACARVFSVFHKTPLQIPYNGETSPVTYFTQALTQHVQKLQRAPLSKSTD